MASGPIISWQTDVETVKDFIFLGSKITADSDYSHEIKRHLHLGRKAMTDLDSVLKSRDITLPTKVCIVIAMIFFPSSHVWMWELDHKEGWAPKNWCFQTAVLEKTSESDYKEIQPVNPKGNQPWVFIGRTDAKAKAKATVLWPPDAKSQLTGKDPDAWKDWRQKEKGMTENEMVGWHHWFNEHEFEWTLEDSEGQGSLACCNSWGHKESDTT